MTESKIENPKHLSDRELMENIYLLLLSNKKSILENRSVLDNLSEKLTKDYFADDFESNLENADSDFAHDLTTIKID